MAKRKSATLKFSATKLCRFREAAGESGMTQLQLAVAIGVDTGTISRWERGLAVPDAGDLAKLAGIMGVGIEELFE